MKRNKLLTVLISTICLLLLVVASFVVLVVFRVKNEYCVELGQEISAEVFRRYSWDKGAFVWTEQPDTSTPGIKEGKIQVFPITYHVTLEVKESESSTPVPTETVYADPVPTEPAVAATAVPTPTEIPKKVKDAVVLELGTDVPAAEEFLCTDDYSEVEYITEIGTINVMTEGSHEIRLLVDGEEEVSALQVKDTTAPVLVLCEAETWLNKPLEPNAFINFELTADNSDAFDTAFAEEPDWSLEGEQVIKISATDASGNRTVEATKVVIKKDQKAPVVTVTDIDVKVGGTVSYKKAVSYYDDIDTVEEMKLSIERTGVNLKEVGTYEVTYTVTDCSGNSTSVIGKINVMEEAPMWEDEEAIHTKAQNVLDSILTENMTDREKAYEIYKWIKNNINYISHSEKGNYIRGAYEGLFKQEGDCFVYAATAKELLTLAGIQNIDIVKATTNPSHYWNLVYIEDGWYHFDSTPRKDKSEFFLLTDSELEAYSSTHNNTHIFDRSLYPEIK